MGFARSIVLDAPEATSRELTNHISGVAPHPRESTVAWDYLFNSLLGTNPANITRQIDPVGNYSHEHGVWWGLDQQLYGLTSEMLDRDAVIGAAVETAIARVQAREVQFQAPDDSPAAQEVASFVESSLFATADDSNGWHSLLAALLRGALKDGIAIVEIVWAVRDGWIVPAGFFHRYPGQFGFDTLGRLMLRVPSGRWELAPQHKFIILRRPGNYSNPWGDSAILHYRYHYWFRKRALLAMVEFSESYGSPLVAWKLPRSSNKYDEEKALAEQALKGLRANTGLVLPADCEIEVVNRSSGSGNATPHERLYRLTGQEIATGILGSVLSTQAAEHSTQATARVHALTDHLRSGALAALVGPAIKRDLAVPLVLLNFGPDAPVPAITLDHRNDLSPSDRLDLLERAHALDVAVTVRQIREITGAEAPVRSEPVVSASAAGEGLRDQPAPASAAPADAGNTSQDAKDLEDAADSEAFAADSFAADSFAADFEPVMDAARVADAAELAATLSAADYTAQILAPAWAAAADNLRAAADADETLTLERVALVDARLWLAFPGREKGSATPSELEFDLF
ncbi:MAG: DUF935 family protein, partial [Planctomycetales bacterium]|nr:DUF935 family protein [Planctomycetales bacterium]